MARSVSARNWTARSSICWSLARTVLPILRSTRMSNGAVPSRSKPPAMRCGRSCGRDVSKQVSYVSASRFDTMSGNAASSKSESPWHGRAMPVRPGRHAARFPIPLRHGTWSCPRRPSAVAAVSTRPAIAPVPDRFRSVRSADGSVPPSSRARPRRSCPMADPRRSMRAHARPAAESWRWPSACRGGRRPPTPVPPRQAGVPIRPDTVRSRSR